MEWWKIIGCASEEDGLRALAILNGSITQITALAGTSELDAAIPVVRANAQAVQHIEQLTGKKGSEALALVTAWKQGAADTQAARDEVAAIKKTGADANAKAALDKAVADGRLQPANRGNLEGLYAKFGAEALEQSIAALPPATAQTPTSNTPEQPPIGGGSTNPTITAADREVAKHMGKKPEDVAKARVEVSNLPTTGDGRIQL